ncbi:hypothetical protein N8914_05425 [Planktomarina temperata]|nr:hypothetical protein [Planktomarina temperata]
MLVRFVSVVLVLLSAACAAPTRDLAEEIVPIGNFRLGQMVPRAEAQLAKGPLSRSASREEWMQALDLAFKERFSRFEGGSYYHLGITAGGYVLAKPGIPFFAAPKSILIFTVIVVEDHTGKVLTEEPHQITVIERLTGGSILGSGLTRSRAQQMQDLAEQAARKNRRMAAHTALV